MAKSTNVKITDAVGDKILQHLKQKPHGLTRALILKFIGEKNGGGYKPFDHWAKSNLQSLGKGKGYKLRANEAKIEALLAADPTVKVKQSRTRLSDEQKETLALEVASDALLVTPPLDKILVKTCAVKLGIHRLPTNILTTLRGPFNGAYQNLLTELFGGKNANDAEEHKEEGGLDITTIDSALLVNELLRRAPSLVPNVQILLSALAPAPPEVSATSGAVEKKTGPTPWQPTSKKPWAHIVIAGVFGSMSHNLPIRPGIKEAIADGRLKLTFLANARHRQESIPTSSTMAIALNSVGGNLRTVLRRAFADSLHFCHGVKEMEGIIYDCLRAQRRQLQSS